MDCLSMLDWDELVSTSCIMPTSGMPIATLADSQYVSTPENVPINHHNVNLMHHQIQNDTVSYYQQPHFSLSMPLSNELQMFESDQSVSYRVPTANTATAQNCPELRAASELSAASFACQHSNDFDGSGQNFVKNTVFQEAEHFSLSMPLSNELQMFESDQSVSYRVPTANTATAQNCPELRAASELSAASFACQHSNDFDGSGQNFVKNTVFQEAEHFSLSMPLSNELQMFESDQSVSYRVPTANTATAQNCPELRAASELSAASFACQHSNDFDGSGQNFVKNTVFQEAEHFSLSMPLSNELQMFESDQSVSYRVPTANTATAQNCPELRAASELSAASFACQHSNDFDGSGQNFVKNTVFQEAEHFSLSMPLSNELQMFESDQSVSYRVPTANTATAQNCPELRAASELSAASFACQHSNDFDGSGQNFVKNTVFQEAALNSLINQNSIELSATSFALPRSLPESTSPLFYTEEACSTQFAPSTSTQKFNQNISPSESVHVKDKEIKRGRKCNGCTCNNCKNRKNSVGLIGTFQHSCDYDKCGELFCRSSHLKAHIRSRHTGERPYQCCFLKNSNTICGKTFYRSDLFLRHQRIHTKEAKHVCPTCAKGFTRSDHLNKHIKTHQNPRRKIQMYEVLTIKSINNNACAKALSRSAF